MLTFFLNILLFFIAVFYLLVALLIGSSAIVIFIVRVPFAPTPKKNVRKIIDLLELKPGQIFYDLGCGDGRFLIEAEKRGAKAKGFEISPYAYLRAKLNLAWHKSKAKVIYKNFYHEDIADADAVFAFLIDTVMPKVEEKLKKELKSGAKIACYGFKLPTWKPEKIIDLIPKDKKSSNIYLYNKS